MSQAKRNYFIERETQNQSPPGVYGYLSPCENCAGKNSSTWACDDSTLSNQKIELYGEDPDIGTNDWPSEDIVQTAAENPPRTDVDHRWPYQIFTRGLGNGYAIEGLDDHGCSASCAYLIRIKYKIFTSSRRRSYLQCGLSDIFLVERYDSSDNIVEQFNVASSVPFIYEQDIDTSKQFLKK